MKVNGYRIELGEVEAALARCPGVRAAVAAVVGDRETSRQLVGYVVGGEADEVLAALRELLPDYLVPRRLMVLGELPLSRNGKVDRDALPRTDAPAGGEAACPAWPADEVESALADIWREFFGLEAVSVTASFLTSAVTRCSGSG
ncbi:hypothetical protein [Frankia sp. Cppng1_Ct_nod]|uniref:AMP-binding enzyme n=1 Tax=Frankia sp. Cppng1_Ct_nod TaxID=2897162 RepID=UPI001F5F22F7|nr:hypothetical protein [Frankia sp. Cppng1_Ct_nod]